MRVSLPSSTNSPRPLKCGRALPSVRSTAVAEVAHSSGLSVQETLMRLGRHVSVFPARLNATTSETRTEAVD